MSYSTLKGEKYVYIDSLLALAACTPSSLLSHDSGWGKIVTPLRVSAWEKGLASHPDRDFAKFICDGVREGFRVGFNYRMCQCHSLEGNMRSMVEHREVVERYVQGKREAGRLLGTFCRSRYPDVQVSPFGVIPKSEPGEWRLIVNLSAPIGCSVNDGIESSHCSLTYLTMDDIVRKVRECGREALMAKFDIKSAYRNVPIHPDEHCWQIFLTL